LDSFHAKKGATEGMVNYALSIRGIVFAALIKESETVVKMSFRSVGDFPANTFAKENFSGGGHKNAAGGKSDVSLAETEKKFLSQLESVKDQLKAEAKCSVQF
jgi:phosphoesterase RecJ-like protein